MKIPKMVDNSHKRAGKFDNAKRWYPHADIHETLGAFECRSPSRSFPYSYLKHFYTGKFATLLFKHDLQKYFDLNRIEKGTELHDQLIAEAFKRKILKG